MNNTVENQIRNLNIQTLVTLTFIVTSILSIILLLNEKDYLQSGFYRINKRKAHNISLFARSLDLVLILILLYINYDNRKFSNNAEELNSHNLQVTASIFSLISAIIVVYVIASNDEINNITDVENPLV